MAGFYVRPCDGCRRVINGGETCWESAPSKRLDLTFCYECGCGVVLNFEAKGVEIVESVRPFGGAGQR